MIDSRLEGLIQQTDTGALSISHFPQFFVYEVLNRQVLFEIASQKQEISSKEMKLVEDIFMAMDNIFENGGIAPRNGRLGFIYMTDLQKKGLVQDGLLKEIKRVGIYSFDSFGARRRNERMLMEKITDLNWDLKETDEYSEIGKTMVVIAPQTNERIKIVSEENQYGSGKMFSQRKARNVNRLLLDDQRFSDREALYGSMKANAEYMYKLAGITDPQIDFFMIWTIFLAELNTGYREEKKMELDTDMQIETQFVQQDIDLSNDEITQTANIIDPYFGHLPADEEAAESEDISLEEMSPPTIPTKRILKERKPGKPKKIRTEEDKPKKKYRQDDKRFKAQRKIQRPKPYFPFVDKHYFDQLETNKLNEQEIQAVSENKVDLIEFPDQQIEELLDIGNLQQTFYNIVSDRLFQGNYLYRFGFTVRDLGNLFIFDGMDVEDERRKLTGLILNLNSASPNLHEAMTKELIANYFPSLQVTRIKREGEKEFLWISKMKREQIFPLSGDKDKSEEP